MSDPIIFDTASRRFALPLLYAGQAQKEFFVNEAHTLIDTLLHAAVEGVVNAPPTAPIEGQCWLVGTAPTGVWVGQAGKLSTWYGGNWRFTSPCDGMRVLNRANGHDMRYYGGWHSASATAAPSGGTTIDAEARVAIVQLIAALSASGIFPAT